MKRKELSVEIEESTPAGGRIRISTGALDRQLDRVIPSGAQIDNYMRNPVVQWGHDYSSPWATIGETLRLEIYSTGITAEFTLRDPVNDFDPMTIVRALWTQGLIRTASIGFNPSKYDKNQDGGYDFTEWELLEWSLVPVPANQEALRLAVKSLDTQDQQGVMTPDGQDVQQPLETNDAGTELSPEDEALSDAINQLRVALSELKSTWEVHNV